MICRTLTLDFHRGGEARLHATYCRFPSPQLSTLHNLQLDRIPMDSRAVDRIFRRLFANKPCTACVRRVARKPLEVSSIQRRTVYNRRVERSTNESAWQQRTEYMAEDKMDEYKRVPMVDSNMLRNRRERPRRVKMLMRDFIEGQFHTHRQRESNDQDLVDKIC